MDVQITEAILVAAGYNSFRDRIPEHGRLVEVFCFPLDGNGDRINLPQATFDIFRGMVHEDTGINAIVLTTPVTMIPIEDGEIAGYEAAEADEPGMVILDEYDYSDIYWRYHIPPTITLPRKRRRKMYGRPRKTPKTEKEIIPFKEPAAAAESPALAARRELFGGKGTRKSRKTIRKSRRKKH